MWQGEGEVGFKGGSSSQHGVRKGEVGEEAVQGSEMMREREMRGLGSGVQHGRHSACEGEERGGSGESVSLQVRERGECKGSARGRYGVCEGEVGGSKAAR